MYLFGTYFFLTIYTFSHGKFIATPHMDCCTDSSIFDMHMAGMDRPIVCMVECLLLIFCVVIKCVPVFQVNFAQILLAA